MNIVSFAVTKAFDAVSSSVPAAEAGKFGLAGWMVGHVGSWVSQQILDAGTERGSSSDLADGTPSTRHRFAG